ncbi:MAG: hypothetical protein HC871_09695 [Rhizobiales bacterium]|nr:hypothetical protein [Hyphomicrobiales bacterium]
MRRHAYSIGLIAALLLGGQASAQDGNWVGSWTASAQPSWQPDFAVGLGIPDNLWNQTVRQNALVSIGGSRARIEVSNEYGDFPITIAAGHLALAGEGSAIVESTDRALTFGGEPSITIRRAPWCCPILPIWKFRRSPRSPSASISTA